MLLSAMYNFETFSLTTWITNSFCFLLFGKKIRIFFQERNAAIFWAVIFYFLTPLPWTLQEWPKSFSVLWSLLRFQYKVGQSKLGRFLVFCLENISWPIHIRATPWEINFVLLENYLFLSLLQKTDDTGIFWNPRC